MKKLILIILLLVSAGFAQEYKVVKLEGEVMIMKGTSEELIDLKKGDIVGRDDLILTGEESFVVLSGNDGGIELKENSALPLDYLKAMSVSELLMALAMEDIRNVPKEDKKNDRSSNTAVYGSRESGSINRDNPEGSFGEKKINGAKQLARQGFKESSIILAKETFRKYPSTGKDVSTRIYFSDLLNETGLYEETLNELKSIKELDLKDEDASTIDSKIEELKRLLTAK
jgi:hypothetical protein